MTTLRDVALAANVSIATASRVINDNRPVHPAIREAVEAAAKRLNYYPNAAARSLRKARSLTLGMITLSLMNETSVRAIAGIESVVSERGFGLFVCDARDSTELCLKHLGLLQEHRVEGIILTPTRSRRVMQLLGKLEAQGTKIVLIGRREASSEFHEVILSEYERSLEAFRLLLGLGHRRIVFTSRSYSTRPGRIWGTTVENRIAAYRQTHQEAGVEVDDRNFVAVEQIGQAQELIAGLLREPNRPTAIVVGNSADTPDVLLAIKQAGLRMPSDVSLIVYGDSRWTEAHDPPISTIVTDDAAYGRRAAELLATLIAGEPTERVISFPTTFVRRASCVPPPARIAGDASHAAK